MIVVIVMMFCMVLVAVGAYLFLNRPQEGDECEGKDENGNYVIDDKGKCVLDDCVSGYYKSGKECLVDQSGVDCEPEGTPDPQGVYLTDQMGGCELSSCETGYMVVDTKCEVDTSVPITFMDSTIPGDALVIEPGEIPVNVQFTSPKDSTLESMSYYFSLQGDGQLVWVKKGTGTVWAMGSHATMPNTKLYFQPDGNICARGTTDICMNSAGGARVPTHNLNVPAGQHRLVGTKEGLLYVDHGTGVEGRSVIYTPP
jgi:hypothetical protein